MNRHLYNDYKTKFAQRSALVTRNEKLEFIRSNSNRIFTRRQLVKFLMKVDPALSLKKAQEKADGQTENHPEDFCMINEASYKAMLSNCIEKIDHYASPEKKGIHQRYACNHGKQQRYAISGSRGTGGGGG